MRFMAATLILALTTPVHSVAFAQPAPSPPASAPVGPSTNPAPQATTATFGTWTLRCQSQAPGAAPAATNPGRVCELMQGVANERQQPIIQLAIGVPPAGDTAGRRMIVLRLPVNIRTSRPVEMSINDGKIRLPLALQFCLGGFCQAEATLADDALKTLRQKPVAKIQLEFADAAGQNVTLPLSLEGFDAAWGAYQREALKPKP